MADSFDEFIGIGRVLNGDTVVADVRYEVRVYRQFIDTGHAQSLGFPGWNARYLDSRRRYRSKIDSRS